MQKRKAVIIGKVIDLPAPRRIVPQVIHHSRQHTFIPLQETAHVITIIIPVFCPRQQQSLLSGQ